MATQTIRREFRVDGVLTNVTTALLSDPTGTYGVKRDDTDAVVVADGTAMTTSSTGVYEYTFTEPEDGLLYTAYVEFVYDGSTYHFEHDISDEATGTYRTTTDAVRLLGSFEAGIDLSPYIEVANSMVTELAACDPTISDTRLELIERMLAAHFASVANPQINRKKIEEAETYYNKPVAGEGLRATIFGQQALVLDTSGCLDSMNTPKIQAFYVGNVGVDTPTEI